MAKRRVLLVDDEVTLLLTMKAVLEMHGFDVDTAASAREGKSKIKLREYQMVITDMRMESDAAGREVVLAARTAPYHPAVALLTAYPDDEYEDMAADKMLVKAMDTALLMEQLEGLLTSHSAKLQRLATASASDGAKSSAPRRARTVTTEKTAPAEKSAAAKPAARKPAARKSAARKSAAKRLATKRLPVAKKRASKAAVKRVLPKKRKK